MSALASGAARLDASELLNSTNVLKINYFHKIFLFVEN